MATIVDALIVTLGLDAAAFKRGKSEATNSTKKLTAEELKAAKEIEARNKKAADSFRSVRNELLALLALFTAGLGIKDFTEQTIKGAIATGQLARDLGMVPGQVRAVEQAFDRLGASTTDADDALKGIQEQAAKLKNGQLDDRLSAYLLNASRAGVSADVHDVDDPMKKLEQDAVIAQRLAQTQGRGFAILSLQQEGYTRAMADALMQGPQALRAEVQRQQKLNQLSQDETDRLRALDNRWKDFKEGLANTGARIVIALEPAFNVIVGLLTRMSDWFAAHADQIGTQVKELADRFVAWVTSIDWDKLIADVKDFFAQLDQAAKSLGGWKTVLEAIIALKILSFVGDVLSLARAFTALGSSLGAVATMGGLSLPILSRLMGVAGLLFHSDSLNTGEDKYLDDRQATPGEQWPGDPAGDTRDAANSGGTFERAKYLMTRLRAAGYTDAQAAGIIGSLMQESRLDPNAVNKKSGNAGIAQWGKARGEQFQQQFGHSLKDSTFGEQVDFMLQELKTSEHDADMRIRNATTPEQAAYLHSRFYERPGDAEANIPRRQENAREIYTAVEQANAARIAQQTSSAPAVASSNTTSHVSTTTSTNETNINGPITIHTKAEDAAAIARDFGQQMKVNFTLPQANTGLS